MTRPSCTYCGEDRDGVGDTWGLQGDHVVPKYWPGSHRLGNGNITWACPACNRDKGTNDPATWFFLLVRRDGAVLGRNETLADVRAARLWTRWADDIRDLHAEVEAMLLINLKVADK